MKSLTIGTGLKTISQEAFSGCSGLGRVDIPDNVLHINQQAFYGCSQISEVVMKSVTTIGEEAFSSCSLLKGITIPMSVTKIDARAFASSGLENVDYPTSVTEYENNIFDQCENLKMITIIGDSTKSEMEGYTHQQQPWWTNILVIETVKISEGVTSIGTSSFEGAEKLTSVELSTSVKTIGNRSFKGCVLLESLELNNVESIGEQAFSSIKISSLRITENVIAIGKESFSNCDLLTTVRYPVHEIVFGENIFTECKNLNEMIFYKTEKGDTMQIYENGTQPWSSILKQITTVEFEEGVKYVGDYSFAGAENLTTIN